MKSEDLKDNSLVCAGKGGVLCSAPVLQWTRSPRTLRLYSLIGLNEWLQWDADGKPPESASPLQTWQQTAFWAAACCYISTDVHHPPPLSHGSVGMCRCWSIIVRDQARADDNESTPPKSLPGAWLFVQDSSPFCKATGDPWPPLHRTPGLNANSYILMSCVQPCPPPDTLPDKDTCMLPLILSFSEFCVGGKTPAGH